MIKYILLLLFTSAYVSGQTLSGRLTTATSEPLANVNVIVKNADNPDVIVDFTTTNGKGDYKIEIKPGFENIIVTFTKFGYDTQNFNYTRTGLTTAQRLDVALIESAILLEEIVISESPKIAVTVDTVSYKASAFLDGSERKVEDLLRKLPGIQVDDNGHIKFKGKSVEKVLLEGDDLFDYNYTTGTRNMSVGILDEVQAIENYSDNPLLHGIEDTNKVALNLKLKQGKMDLSGDARLGYGVEDRYVADVNVLSVSQANKNFSTVNYNNSGENHSPYDYFGLAKSPEDLRNLPLMAPKIIDERQFISEVGQKRSAINSNLFTTVNNIYKISKTLNTRVIFSYYKDRLSFANTTQSEYFFQNGTQLITSQQEEAVKRPEQYDGSIKLTWNSSKNSLLEFTSKWGIANLSTTSSLFTNNQNTFGTRVHSEEFLSKQELLYTQKLSDTKSLQTRALFSKSDAPQEFYMNPGLNFLLGEIENNINNRQLSNFTKYNWEAETSLLGTYKEDKYKLSITARNTQNDYSSILYNNSTAMGAGYENNTGYAITEFRLDATYNIKLGKFALKSQLQLKKYHLAITGLSPEGKESKNQAVLAPSVSASYKISDLTRFYANYSYDRVPPQENYMFSQYVLTSERSLIYNVPATQFSTVGSGSLGYGINDIYNQFSLNASLNYTTQHNNFYADTDVKQNLTIVRYFFLPENNTTYGLALNTEKYIPALMSTIKVSGNYTHFEYKNIVNDSDLRNNTSDMIFSQVFFKTALSIPFNFENIFSMQNSVSKSDSYTDTFKNTSLTNTTKILIRPNKRWFGMLSADYFQASVQNPNAYYFLDASVRYTSPKKSWEFSLSGKNLTNNKLFKQIAISDYYTSASSQSLNRAYVLFEVSFQF